MSLSENIRIDDANDLVLAYDGKISGALIRALVEPTAPSLPGEWFRVVRTIDGVTTIERYDRLDS